MTRATVSVTVVILNYQRKHLLRDAIHSALGQEYPDLEVLVVDNASTDGSAEMVAREFPGVRLLRLESNVGCAARNAGVTAARGEIVVTIDNDVILDTPGEVRAAVEILQSHPDVACVNFKILDATRDISRRDWCHPRDCRVWGDSMFPTDYVLEGASALRRRPFLAVGGYWPRLFIGHEGLDLALRLLDAGHDLLYAPAIRVRHLAAQEARPSSRIYYTFVRNGIWIALRLHRPVAAARAIAKDLLLIGFAAGRAGEWMAYLRGVRDAVAGAASVIGERHRLRRETYARLAKIRALTPPLLHRIRRHWRERLI